MGGWVAYLQRAHTRYLRKGGAVTRVQTRRLPYSAPSPLHCSRPQLLSPPHAHGFVARNLAYGHQTGPTSAAVTP